MQVRCCWDLSQSQTGLSHQMVLRKRRELGKIDTWFSVDANGIELDVNRRAIGK